MCEFMPVCRCSYRHIQKCRYAIATTLLLTIRILIWICLNIQTCIQMSTIIAFVYKIQQFQLQNNTIYILWLCLPLCVCAFLPSHLCIVQTIVQAFLLWVITLLYGEWIVCITFRNVDLVRIDIRSKTKTTDILGMQTYTHTHTYTQ